MKLAIADEKDFKLFWSMYKAQQKLDYAKSDLEEERCKKIILGRMQQMGGAFRIWISPSLNDQDYEGVTPSLATLDSPPVTIRPCICGRNPCARW